MPFSTLLNTTLKQQSLNFTGRVALVIGASKGIGEAVSRVLASHGAEVVLIARNEKKLTNIVDQILKDGFKARFYAADVTSFESVSNVVEQVIRELGSIDFLINNAGTIEPISLILESDSQGWSDSIDVNLKGTYFGIRAVAPHMKREGHGVIINLSSGAASRAIEGWSHYCAAKAGVRILTECVQLELEKFGIRASSLSPGTVATDMQRAIKASGINDVSKLEWDVHIQPEWVGHAVAFLCSPDGAKYSGKEFSLRTSEAKHLLGMTS